MNRGDIVLLYYNVLLKALLIVFDSCWKERLLSPLFCTFTAALTLLMQQLII